MLILSSVYKKKSAACCEKTLSDIAEACNFAGVSNSPETSPEDPEKLQVRFSSSVLETIVLLCASKIKREGDEQVEARRVQESVTV